MEVPEMGTKNNMPAIDYREADRCMARRHLCVGDIQSLFNAAGFRWGDLERRAEQIVARRTRHLTRKIDRLTRSLKKQIEDIRAEVEWREIKGRLFDQYGNLLRFPTVKEYAERQGVRPGTVYGWIRSGRIPESAVIRGYLTMFIDIEKVPAKAKESKPKLKVVDGGRQTELKRAA
jgi:hypothetical protein